MAGKASSGNFQQFIIKTSIPVGLALRTRPKNLENFVDDLKVEMSGKNDYKTKL